MATPRGIDGLLVDVVGGAGSWQWRKFALMYPLQV